MSDEQIGKILVHAPAASDGVWPAVAVRALLEEVDGADIENGLFVGVYTKRGVVTRGHGDGGQPERPLGLQYRAWADACAGWPRIATVLRQLANQYDADARNWDLRDARRYNKIRGIDAPEYAVSIQMQGTYDPPLLV